tara:strand:+ start:139 stop:240 length:102 start_codon:yes stop_codon:yes gene_type:complete
MNKFWAALNKIHQMEEKIDKILEILNEKDNGRV